MSNCSIAIQILPLDSNEENTLKVVDRVIQFIRSRTDNYHVSSFETTIEGEYEEVMALLSEVIKIAGSEHPDIFANVKVRYKGNEEKVLTTDEKTSKYNK
jgi:uncharacterized protein YqgV (UPF0045/DUF77 family)